jgi:two-component system response regulator YesN
MPGTNTTGVTTSLRMSIDRNYSPYDVERARNAIDFIQKHYDKPINVDDVAESVNMPRKKLQLLIRLLTGCTMHAYVISIRIERAESDLADFSKPIKYIAYKYGFSSSWHFILEFKKRKDMTPGQYRSNLLATYDPLDGLQVN